MTEQQFNNQFFRKGMKVKLNNGEIKPIIGVDFEQMDIEIGDNVWVPYSKCEVYYNELLDLFKHIMCEYFKLDQDQIIKRYRQGDYAPARALIMIMAIDSKEYSQEQIAEYLGLNNHSAVCVANRNTRHYYHIIDYLKVIKIKYAHLIKNIEKYKCFKT